MKSFLFHQEEDEKNARRLKCDSSLGLMKKKSKRRKKIDVIEDCC
jgi:hypothetical protein